MPATGAEPCAPQWGAITPEMGEISMTQPATGAPATGAPATDPSTAPGNANPTPPANPPAPTDTTDWKAEYDKLKAESTSTKADADKWKALSRKNENDLRAERDKLAKAGMSEPEKALAEAEERGRKAARAEAGKVLAAAELRAALSEAGIKLGEAFDDIDTSKYVDSASGEVDKDAIAKAVARFATLAPKPATPPTPAGKSGVDIPGGTGAGTPITEDQLAAMGPAEVAKAFAEGKLRHLM